MLYGCDSCITDVEQYQKSLQEPLRPLLDEAFEYSDGYTLEVTFSFSIPAGAGGIPDNTFYGACIEHEESGG